MDEHSPELAAPYMFVSQQSIQQFILWFRNPPGAWRLAINLFIETTYTISVLSASGQKMNKVTEFLILYNVLSST